MLALDDLKHVLRKPLPPIPIGGPAGCSISAARDRVDMTTVEEFRGELVKGMTAITRAGQQDDRSSRPAPIEEFEVDPGATVTNRIWWLDGSCEDDPV